MGATLKGLLSKIGLLLIVLKVYLSKMGATLTGLLSKGKNLCQEDTNSFLFRVDLFFLLLLLFKSYITSNNTIVSGHDRELNPL